MNIAILGTGVVGISLAKGFVASGHTVTFGTRNPGAERARAALSAVPGATALSPLEAAGQADLAVLALPWNAVLETLQALGPKALAGRVLIDATNPLDFSSGAPKMALGFSDSAGETVQRLLPEAHVVKAFNIITANHMVNPKLADGVPDMLIAGNDTSAKEAVSKILRDFGWRSPIDMGDITASRLLEPFAMVWIEYGVRNGHWTHAFSLLGRK